MTTPSIFKSESGKQAILEMYDTLLKMWPVPYEGLTLATNLGKTFAIASGNPANPPLILLHGSTSNATMWGGDVAQFARQYRVYALDIPGEPGRSDPARPELSGAAYAEWLEQVLDLLGIQTTRLCGISLGGWLALKFATACPERVERLALLCPAGVAPQKASFLPKAVVFSLLGSWGLNQMLKLLAGSAPLDESAAKYTGVMAHNFRPRMEVIPLYTDDELRRLTMPVLLLAGEKDNLLPSQQTADRLQRLLPCLTARILPGAGHVLIGLSNQIVEFLTN